MHNTATATQTSMRASRAPVFSLDARIGPTGYACAFLTCRSSPAARKTTRGETWAPSGATRVLVTVPPQADWLEHGLSGSTSLCLDNRTASTSDCQSKANTACVQLQGGLKEQTWNKGRKKVMRAHYWDTAWGTQAPPYVASFPPPGRTTLS